MRKSRFTTERITGCVKQVEAGIPVADDPKVTVAWSCFREGRPTSPREIQYGSTLVMYRSHPCPRYTVRAGQLTAPNTHPMQ